MSRLALASSTSRTRQSESFFMRLELFGAIAPTGLRVGEGVALHELFKWRPGLAGEQRSQRGLVGLDEFHRAGIEFREQLGQLRGGRASLRRI